MLSGIRHITRGWIAGGLLAILAASFAIWGVADVLKPVHANAVASGAGIDISTAAFRKEFDKAIDDARTRLKRPVTRQEAFDGGLSRDVLKTMISQAAFDAMARKVGFATSTTAIATLIREDPAFRNQLTGAFDKGQYLKLLAANELTDQEFTDHIRQQMMRRQLGLTFITGVRAPASFAKLLFAYETERRAASVAEITPDRVGKPPEPTDGDLKTFYAANLASFKTPEFRNVTIVKARPDAFAARVDIPEDKIKQLYDFRKPGLPGGEKRSFAQISAPDQATATEAARRLAAGEDPQKIAGALKAQLVPFTNVTRREVPDAAVGEAVFGLQKGQSTGAIHGKLAWAAARLTDITSGAAPTLESMHDALRAELAKEEAQNLLNDAVDKYNQEVGQGKSAEDAAKDAGLDVFKLAKVSAQGQLDQGGAAPGLADAPDLLKSAFLAPVGEATEFTPTPEGGYALVRVDAVIPPGVRKFDDIAQSLLKPAWQARKTGDAMRAIADSMIKAIGGGMSFEDAAKANKIKVVAKSQLVDRRAMQDPNSNIPMLIQSIFTANEKDVVTAPDARGAVLLVAQVEHIERQKPEQNPEAFGQAMAAANKMVSEDLIASLQAQAVSDAKVRTNDKLVAQTLGVEETPTGAPATQ